MFRYDCNTGFFIRLELNKVRTIYLCSHNDLINMHKWKPEVTLNYHIWKCYVISSQSKFWYNENVYKCLKKLNTSSKIACIHDTGWSTDLCMGAIIVFRQVRRLNFFLFLVSFLFLLCIHPRVVNTLLCALCLGLEQKGTTNIVTLCVSFLLFRWVTLIN